MGEEKLLETGTHCYDCLYAFGPLLTWSNRSAAIARKELQQEEKSRMFMDMNEHGHKIQVRKLSCKNCTFEHKLKQVGISDVF